ncbi:patched domain-containing protein 3-like [Neocloeon triangulifer]|uniref:patched domain-containing protein 3-like n=1 Tax=Neocloeon triangulifer TaxID=2078957 RepID=UPI00286EC0BE|nr:patched domain-containing protein 3-like [Neocloeon triangulifer]
MEPRIVRKDANGRPTSNGHGHHKAAAAGRCSRFVQRMRLETAFYKLGRLIGAHPVLVLAASVALCGLTSIGLMFWRQQLNDLELFLPEDSPIRRDAAWVDKWFSEEMVFESVIVVADNVLDQEVIRTIAELHEDVRNINVTGGVTWDDLCARVLVWMDAEGDENVVSLVKQYNEHGNDCIQESILALWSDASSAAAASQEEIFEKFTSALNNSNSQGIGTFKGVRHLLSGVTYSEDGVVTGATATILTYSLKKGNADGLAWEEEFMKVIHSNNRTLPPSVEIFALANRSYNDALQEVLDSNLTVLFSGFSLIVVYVVAMMGRANRLENRVYLALSGGLTVPMAIAASFGFCFSLNYHYGPIHPILPFLLLGVGVDDMFIIVQALDDLTPAEKELSVPERVGRALRHAGSSVTVTSLTNIVAFAVGANTKMPTFKSFCFFASMGILFLYIFVLTFFVGCVTLDERRRKANRDGCLPCVVREDLSSNECSQHDHQKAFFHRVFAPCLMKTPVKVLVILTTLTLVGFNAYSAFQVEQKFDPVLYLRNDSYPRQFQEALKSYFPKLGQRGGIYIGAIDYFEQQEALLQLAESLRQNPYINSDNFGFWLIDFTHWMKVNSYEPEDYREFRSYLAEFLFTTDQGYPHIKDVKIRGFPFHEYEILATRIPIQHVLLNGAWQQAEAMTSVHTELAAAPFAANTVAFAKEYVSWTANQIIGEELLRNFAFTLTAVSGVTVLLIRDLVTSASVIACVVCTLVGLVGSMVLFGLTVEITTSIVVTLCVGLAVDYSAHVGHKFATLKGGREQRARDTLELVGPPVFNGGFSTFLAFVMLGFSDSFIFTTFFKLFFSVVVYGLFHGLIFLPVVLSILGPSDSSGPSDQVYTVPVQNGSAHLEMKVGSRRRCETEELQRQPLADSLP